MAEIRHIAVWTENPDELAEFYIDTFGMKVLQPLVTAPDRGTWVILTDGHVRLALINPGLSGSLQIGPHHVAFEATEEERETILRKLQARGIHPESCANPYVEDRVRDVDGNVVDISGNELRLRAYVRLAPLK